MLLKTILIPLLMLTIVCGAQAQERKVAAPQEDTNHVYLRIEKFSNKRKVTRLLYPLIFKPSRTVLDPTPESHDLPRQRPDYEQAEGKVIRSVKITTLDPFGYSVVDSIPGPINAFGRSGNVLHVKTLPLVLKNYILVKPNERFDSLLVDESERLIRKQRFVQDVAFSVVPAGTDSVDILIREIDMWSLTPDGLVSETNQFIKLQEQNILGTGQQLFTSYNHNSNPGRSYYEIGYDLPNFNNSFVAASFLYHSSNDRAFIRRMEVGRSFYSSFTQWAGGILLEQQMKIDSIILSRDVRLQQKYRIDKEDLWMGKSWPLFSGNAEIERTTNLVMTARWLHLKFPEKPGELLDTANYFQDQTFIVTGIGINSRKYLQDNFLFRFGVTEDIPVGRSYSLIFGNRRKDARPDWYAGVSLASGDFYPLGFLSSRLEYGTFFSGRQLHEGVMKGEVNYFSNLFEWDQWKFRQFARLGFEMGINRLPYEKLNFNSDMGQSGYDEAIEQGTRKLLLALQFQSYAPWSLLGFRFGPMIRLTAGILGNQSDGFSKSKLNTSLGFGVLIKNDFLNTNYFQISLSYYPIVPGDGRNVLSPNTFQASDFRVQDYDAGKPGEIGF